MLGRQNWDILHKLYHSSLLVFTAKLLTEELKQPPIQVPTKFSPKQTKVSPPEPMNKKEYEDFSDGTDEATTDEMDLESVERLDSYNMDEDQKGTLKILHLNDHLTCSSSCMVTSCMLCVYSTLLVKTNSNAFI